MKEPMMTREAIVRRLAQRWQVQKSIAQGRINDVLDEVLRIATPKLEREWSGGEVLHALYELRGGRPQ